MFSPVPMLRLSAVVLERDERAVLRALGELGAMHLLRERAGPETAPMDPPDHGPALARWRALLDQVEDLRCRLGVAPVGTDAAIEPSALTLAEAEAALAPLSGRADELLRQRDALQQRWGQVTAVLEQVSSYMGLGVPFDQLERFTFLHFATGTLPEGGAEAVRGAVADNVVLLPAPPRGGREPVIAVTSHKGRFALATTLEQAGFQPEKLGAGDGLDAEALAGQSAGERQRLAEAMAENRRALEAFAAEAAGPLRTIAGAGGLETRLLEAEQLFPRTDVTVLITGWVPASEEPEIERRLRAATGGRCAVEVTKPAAQAEAEVPVLLRHPRLLRPFEMLVAGYGLPLYRELEPTLFAAITYILMFGIMFGDVGHGAVLAAAGGIARKVGKTPKTRDGGILVALAGISSVVFGALYGSYFGIEGLRRYALWRDPLEGDPMSLMYTAMGIGVVIISIGVILNIINRFRRGDLVGGFLDKFGVAGALFYWGVLALLLKYAAFRERGLIGPVVVLVIVVPLVGLALKEPIAYALSRRAGHTPHAENLLQAVTESLVEVFEAVLSYMANTISFVRLAAYAMSHAAILMATFLMAAEVQKVSMGGGALSVLVIIAGNLVAILLEGVIAAVQALRLEYYEFFGKFYSGSGQAFRPFRLPAG